MITDLEIEGLRGVLEGRISGLGGGVVLVGPNGSGKSTVLDALMLGGAYHPGDAIGRVVRRRPYTYGGGRWLFHRKLEPSVASVRLTRLQGSVSAIRSTTLRPGDAPDSAPPAPPLPVDEQALPSTIVRVETTVGQALSTWCVTLGARGVYRYTPRPAMEGWNVRLVDVPRGVNQDLTQVYSFAVQQGRKGEVLELLREATGDGLRDITLIAEDGLTPVLHMEYADGSVPVFVAGEGLSALVRLSLELVNVREGTLLLEEPETALYPRLMALLARLIWAAIARGAQVIMSTHSVEFVDALLAAAPPGRLSDLSLYRCALAQGSLSAVRYSGEEARLARHQFEEDLR